MQPAVCAHQEDFEPSLALIANFGRPHVLQARQELTGVSQQTLPARRAHQEHFELPQALTVNFGRPLALLAKQKSTAIQLMTGLARCVWLEVSDRGNQVIPPVKPAHQDGSKKNLAWVPATNACQVHLVKNKQRRAQIVMLVSLLPNPDRKSVQNVSQVSFFFFPNFFNFFFKLKKKTKINLSYFLLSTFI
jgi:hypothetical protein